MKQTRTIHAGIGMSGDAGTLVLHREDLAVEARVMRGDTVRVETVTELREQRVEVPLMHERIDVRRVPIGRYVDRVPDARHEGDLTVLPVVEEVLVLERRLLLKEEVHIRRVDEVEQRVETVVLRVQRADLSRRPAAAGAPHQAAAAGGACHHETSKGVA